MNRDVRLYIDGNLVEWSKVPDILLTYETTDYTNPTVVKNSYSKTVTVDGTQNNNNIFNHIWKLDRIMDENFTLFNPSQRVPYELFNNGDIVSKGYAKLDSVKKTGYKIEYNIILYGGLGSFFYSLAYDLNTDKEKTLADLNFTNSSNPEDEFNFEINKDSVFTAWDSLKHFGSNVGEKMKWDFINFTPCYNGFPEDFDSDRVLINCHYLSGTQVRYTNNGRIVNGNFPYSISDGETTYGLLNGYVSGKMMNQCDEWELRDLRSYLQRPALSIKGLFTAVCDPQNNGGYNVVLDPDFFNQDNPYYWNAWITLPMLNPETNAADEDVEWNWYKQDQMVYSPNSVPTEVKFKLATTNSFTGTPDTFSMDVEIHSTITGTSADRLYLSTAYQDLEGTTKYIYGGLGIQLYGYGDDNGVWYTKSGKCGSNIVCLATKVGGVFIDRNILKERWTNIPYSDVDVVYNFGYWKKVSGSDYIWHNETDDTDIVHIEMDTNLMSAIPNVGLAFAGLKTNSDGSVIGNTGTGGKVYEALSQGSSFNTFEFYRTMSLNDIESKAIYKVNSNMRSFQPVTKKDVLGGLDGTPCDWFLSYCKLFGLFIEKDKVDDTIYVRMRCNFYKDETVDLEELIDRSQTIDVNPLTFESKWYNFNYGEANSKFLDRYKKTYSQDFGKQLIDTKYNFDADEIDLLEDNSFRNGLTALEKSNYFNSKFDLKSNPIPQCLFNWCTVTYYNNDQRLDTEMCLPSQNTIEPLNPKTPKEFYDAMPKLEFYDEEKNPTDGEGVLVIFNGMQDLGKVNYWLSDDIEEMFLESDNPCWLQTVNEWNRDWTKKIAKQISVLPQFTRYSLHNDIITASFDFGYTKELYVPYYKYDVNRTPTLYENYWKSYIRDLYSVNTRKVDCYVAINSNDVYDFMRKFYWWDNSLWVCAKVQDYDIALDKATKCSFTKVNDKSAYLESPTFDDFLFNFYRIGNTGNVPASGTSEELSVYFNLDSSSDWNVANEFQITYFASGYPTNGEYVIGETLKATFTPNTSPLPRYETFAAWNEDGQIIYITVYQDGYVKPQYLTVDPDHIVLPRVVMSGVPVTVSSSSDWHSDSPLWVVIPPTSTTSGDTTIIVSATTNEDKVSRSGEVYFYNEEGLTDVLYINQMSYPQVSLMQNEIQPVYSVPSTGGNVFYKIITDTECTVEPLGDTSDFTAASGLVTYGSTILPTSGTNFWIHFSQNTSTVSRNAVFAAVYADGEERHFSYPYNVTLPLVQQADHNVIVELTASSQNKTQALGANLNWTATCNSSWITLNSTTGSSSDTSITFSVTSNSGNLRVGYITITYVDNLGYNCTETIEVYQKGNSSLNVSPVVIKAGVNGGSYVVNVSASTAYTVSSSDSWYSGEKFGTSNVIVNIPRNDGYERTSTMTITCSGETVTISIEQDGISGEYTLDYQPEDIVFESTGGTIDITIRSNAPWEITDNNG